MCNKECGAMTHQETTDRINALAYALGALNDSIGTLPFNGGHASAIYNARSAVADETQLLTMRKAKIEENPKVAEKEKTNQNLKDKDLVNGSYVYSCVVSNSENEDFRTIEMVASPLIHNKNELLDAINNNAYEIGDSESVSVSVASLTYGQYQNLSKVERNLMNVRIEASGNNIPTSQD